VQILEEERNVMRGLKKRAGVGQKNLIYGAWGSNRDVWDVAASKKKYGGKVGQGDEKRLCKGKLALK